MKTCTGCKQTKPLHEFNRETRRRSGLMARCQTCENTRKAAWREKNREKCKAYQQAYEAKNPERVAASKKAYIAANRDAHYERVLRWHAANPAKRNAATARRYIRRKQAVPPWSDVAEIDKFYAMARWCTEVTGIEHVVDHVIPLRGRKVSGLHVHTNLRVITGADNRRKSYQFKTDWEQPIPAPGGG